MIYYAIISYDTIYYTILCYAIPYYTILYYTILYYTVIGIQTMALLEVPETVRGHLGAHEFIQAARAAMVDASHLQDDVEELLMESRASAAADQGFDTAALVRQQAAAFRGLPRQIAVSCLYIYIYIYDMYTYIYIYVYIYIYIYIYIYV